MDLTQNHIHSHNKPWNEVRWKAPATRQPHLYNHQDDRLPVENGETVINSFFKFYKSDLEPPRRYENLRKFLERSGARSVHDVEADTTGQNKIPVIVDDRCDPCIKLNIPENTGIIQRPWNSDIYNQRPPKGENAEVYGADVQTLFQRFREPVCLRFLCLCLQRICLTIFSLYCFLFVFIHCWHYRY